MATLLQADLLIDGLGGSIPRGGVLVEGAKIVDVGAADELASRADERIERSGTLLPGMCDLHTHVCLSGSTDPAGQLARESRSVTVLRAAENLRRHLAAGVTTIRDVGGLDGIDLEMMQAVEEGILPGPRMLAAGSVICMTGGHACWVGIECDSPDQTRAAARLNLKRGATHLKVIATGGVMTRGVEPGAPQLTEAEMRSVCEEARKAGTHVAAHAQGTEGIGNALRAGVRTIEHGFWIDRRTVELFQETGAFLVPTFAAAKGLAEGAEHGVPEWMVEKMQVAVEAHRASFQSCHASRVPYVAGTDAGTPLNPHGNIVTELEAMVACGCTPMEAIQAATGNASVAIGREDLGALAPGRRADAVLVDGNPLEDLANLRQVRGVWKDGRAVLDAMPTGAER